MSTITVQIGSDIFNIPVEGEGAGWGEELTDFFKAIGDSLATVQNAGDILPTSFALANNQTSYSNITGLNFDTAQVISTEVDYFIKRIYDSGASVVVETGKMLGYYDGTDFVIARDQVGDTGITIDVTSAGQFQYKSSNLANHTSSVIVFKAKTILEP